MGNQEPEHYCPDEEEPIEELADIRPSMIEAAGGELSLEQQGHIEYEDDTAEIEEAPAEEAPATEEPATEESSAQPAEEAAPAQEEYEPTDLETHKMEEMMRKTIRRRFQKK